MTCITATIQAGDDDGGSRLPIAMRRGDGACAVKIAIVGGGIGGMTLALSFSVRAATPAL